LFTTTIFLRPFLIMTTTERRGRLTYGRLITSLERHYDAVATQLPELQDARRVQILQRAINVALNTARAGLSGALVASPAQLKQELKEQIAETHVRCDAVDDASVQAHDGAPDGVQINACTSSVSSGNHDSLLASCQQIAPERARGARDSSKENAVPPTAPVAQPATRKVSAVRKTPITKRAASSNPTTNTGIKKRPARDTCSKASTKDHTATPLPVPDNADLAAADALIELKRSPETSFTLLASSSSSSTVITPSTNRKKRANSVYEDDTSPPHLLQSQELASSSPGPKRRMLALARYEPVPILAQGLSASEVFALGVEYALQHFSANEGYEGEQMRAWVENQLGLQTPSPPRAPLEVDISGTGGSMAISPVNDSFSHSAIGGGRRAFWDVV
jgi:hypothetical protein